MNIEKRRSITIAATIAVVILLAGSIAYINHDKLFKPLIDKTIVVPKEEIIPAQQITVVERQIVPLNEEEKKAYIEQQRRFAREIEKQYKSSQRLGYGSGVASLTARRADMEPALKPYKEEMVEKKVVIPPKKVTKQVKTTIKVTKEGLSFEMGNVVLDIALAAISTVLIYFLKKVIDWYFEKKKILLEHSIAG